MQPKARWTTVFLAGALAVSAAAPTGPRPTPAVSPKARVEPPAPQALLLNGRPFPRVAPFVARLAAPRRTLYVAAGKENGDGSEQRPWNDLQAALCTLGPGDRLRVRAGTYEGAFRVDGPCRDGTRASPIQALFDGKATIVPRGDGAAFAVAKSHWILVGLFIELKQWPGPGVSIEGPAGHDVTFEGARLAGGVGPSVRVGEGSVHVTVANSRIARKPLARRGPSSFGVEIAAGTGDVRLINNHFAGSPAGSIRVEAPAPGVRAARNLLVQGNAIHDDPATSIDIAAAYGARIQDNILSDPSGTETVGLALGRASAIAVRRNHISGFSLGIQVGRASPDGGSFAPASDVTIDRNFLESLTGAGAAADIEAAHRVRFANNVVVGYGTAVTVFGAPPQTQSVTIANNLFLGVSGVAFVLADPAAAALFDYNVFAPRERTVSVEVRRKGVGLGAFLKEGSMPHTVLARGVQILYGDLARISGAEVIDRGTALAGVDAKGSAPDIGVAER